MNAQSSSEKREKTGIIDCIVFLRYWTSNWLKIILYALKRGPLIIGDLRRYPWIRVLLRVNSLLARLTGGRSGNYRKANALVISNVVSGIIQLLEGLFRVKGPLVIHQDMVPPEILRAMGIRTWMPELIGILLPLLEPGSMEKYIDASENEGVPPDICSLPKSVLGLARRGEMPKGDAIVASNLPCDGGLASYSLIETMTNAPIYRLDVPHNFKGDKAAKHFAGDLKEMISWLEAKTGARMDWGRLSEICGERNRQAELEMELWDIISVRPAPMAGEPVYLSHLWSFNVFPGAPSQTRLFSEIVGLARENAAKGTMAVPGEKYRALLWNPPTLHFIDLFAWAERAYGVALIMDSMSYQALPFIDTGSPETMLEGLARIIMEGPMARHTRGPAENYLNDIFYIHKRFSLDMVWVAGHIGCKNTQAMNGMLRELCRKEGIPLLVIEYDLADPRIVTREGIISQVEHFMENIMKAKRLDR